VTTPFPSEPIPAVLTANLNTALAALASGLLLFVSAGVIYLSIVDWRDRRRRRAQKENSGRS
jgi:hypothetical protein